MGLEESKIGQPNKTTCNAPNLCFFAPVLPGRIVHQCTLELWRKSHRELFNFPDKVMVCTYQVPHDCTSAFCLTRQNIVNFRKSCSVFSLRKRREYTKMAEHFEYNHIPAHLSSIQNLHFKSVLDIHSGLAVVHLARDMITQFALVDLRINKFLGSFGRQTVLFSPESTIGKISPDGTYCLVRLPWSRNRRVYILKLYNLRNSELISELPLSNASNYDESSSASSRLPLAPYQEHNRQSNIRTSCDNVHSSSSSSSMNPELRGASQNENQLQLGPARSSQVLFAFDPRFVNSRIAITNVDFPHSLNSHKSSSSNWLPGMQATLSLVKLPTWECLASTNKLCCWSLSSSNRTGPSYVVNNSSSSSSSTSTSTSTRETGRRRRSSDANHHAGNSPNSPNTFNSTFPHVMSIFYSRDGYFLFTITTESRVCRCSVIDNHSHSVNSLLSSETSSYAEDVCHTPNTSRFSSSSTTVESGRNQQRVFSASQSVESTSRYTSKTSNASSPMLAPTLPGCTTLWLTIFNSDTLERLRILRFDRAICPIHTCPTNYLPVMSRCGARIALITRQTVGLHNNNNSSNSSNQSINVNSRECLLSSCKTIPASLRHSVPSINVDACCDSQWVSSKGSGQEISKENSGRRNELKKQQAINSQACLFNQPRNLNLSHHLSTSLPSPLSKVHLSSGGGGGSSTSELNTTTTTTPATSHHRPMTTTSSFESPLVGTRYQSSSANPSCTTATTPAISTTATTTSNNNSGVITIGNSTTNPSVQIDVLLVYQLPPPPKLQALARQRIRQLCKDEHLEHLDLPRRIISYLRFEPSYTCAGSCFSRSNSSTRTIRSDSFDL
ncbi:unnamed protein product [Trichobilharzia szidati]|nr:unnamed protein product [Trichobilharzia szidati]